MEVVTKGHMFHKKNKKTAISAQPIAVTAAVWSVLVMVVLWILGNVGLYVSAVESMIAWHMFFDLTFVGLMTGAIEAAVISLLAVYSFVWIHNVLTR